MDLLIQMTRPSLADLPPVILAEGYRVATASEFADPKPMWAQVINESFEDRNWTVEYIEQNYSSGVQYDPEGVFFVLQGDKAVSTAFAWRDEPTERKSGRIHWVGCVGGHRGKGLAKAVVLSVMHYFKDRGFESAYLETQPFRLPAISLYLALGMDPTPRNAEEEAAWAEVMENLGKRPA